MNNSEFTNERYVDSRIMQVSKIDHNRAAYIQAQCEEELQSGLAEGRITFDNLKEHMLAFETSLYNQTNGKQS